MPPSKGAKTSARLVESMLELLQSRGYHATGLNTVADNADAPKGSLYFHFPGGKQALGEEAVHLAAVRWREHVLGPALDAQTPGEAIRRAAAALADGLEAADFHFSCPVSVVTLELGGHNERLRTACEEAFESWVTAVADRLCRDGHPRAAAHRMATVVVSTLEGALVMSRAQRSVAPLRYAADALASLVNLSAPAGE